MAELNRPNVDIYRRHLAGTGHEHLLKESSYLHIYRNASAVNLEDTTWRLREELGAPLELLSGDELREIEPCLAPDYTAAVLIKDQARAMAPGRIGAVLADKARSLGSVFLQAHVHELRPVENGWSITTDEGDFHSPQVVTAAGAWSDAPARSPRRTRPAGGGTRIPRSVPGPRCFALNNSIMEVDAKFVASSMEMGLRSAGTAEFAGLDAPPNYRRARMLVRQTKRMLPDLNTEDTEEWMGARPSLAGQPTLHRRDPGTTRPVHCLRPWPLWPRDGADDRPDHRRSGHANALRTSISRPTAARGSDRPSAINKEREHKRMKLKGGVQHQRRDDRRSVP